MMYVEDGSYHLDYIRPSRRLPPGSPSLQLHLLSRRFTLEDISQLSPCQALGQEIL